MSEEKKPKKPQKTNEEQLAYLKEKRAFYQKKLAEVNEKIITLTEKMKK